MRPQLLRLIIHLRIWLHSFLFLLVFFDLQANISLLGEVNRAASVHNLWRHGAKVPGFGSLWSEARLVCHSLTKSLCILNLTEDQEPVPITVLPIEVNLEAYRLAKQNDLSAFVYHDRMMDNINEMTDVRLKALKEIEKDKAQVA